MILAPMTAEDVRVVTLLDGGRLTPQEAVKRYRRWVDDGFTELHSFLASSRV
jgi:hypothetical protein